MRGVYLLQYHLIVGKTAEKPYIHKVAIAKILSFLLTHTLKYKEQIKKVLLKEEEEKCTKKFRLDIFL